MKLFESFCGREATISMACTNVEAGCYRIEKYLNWHFLPFNEKQSAIVASFLCVEIDSNHYTASMMFCMSYFHWEFTDLDLNKKNERISIDIILSHRQLHQIR